MVIIIESKAFSVSFSWENILETERMNEFKEIENKKGWMGPP